MAVALILGLGACGGGGGGGDTKAPTITATSPNDGDTGVLTNATLSATFSEPLDPALLDAGWFLLSFNPDVPGDISWDDVTSTATFAPLEDLPAGKLFTATITTSVQDEAGNSLAAAHSWTFTTEPYVRRISLDSNGAEGDADSSDCEQCVPLSADGRFVAFTSRASNLVPEKTGSERDAYRRDTQNGRTIRVSAPNLVDLDVLGDQADRPSEEPSLNADGRYVAFYSLATNLVLDDTNDDADVFVHDTQTGETTRVSVPNLADQGTLGTQGDDSSERASLSADGRYVAFHSRASNLVLADTNDRLDVFVHDHQTGEITRVSVNSNGVQGDGRSSNATISADGRWVAFESAATNLDLVTADTNDENDIFVHDRTTGETIRASVAADGSQAEGPFGSVNTSIGDDGRHVAFWSSATNLVDDDTNGQPDIFVKDLQTGAVARASEPNLADQGTLGTESNDGSQYPSLSGDGRHVAFASDATNLVLDDTNDNWDVFVHDLQTGVTRRLSVSADGTEGNGGTSDWASISGDGRYVVFNADSTNLVGDDLNGVDDVFRTLNAPLPPP